MTKKNRFSLDAEENYEEKPFVEEESSEEYEASHDDRGASDEDFDDDSAQLVDFLKYPRNKRRMTEFLEQTYTQLEEEDVERTINRKLHEHESELEGATPYHKPGHIGPLMYQYLNMVGVESAYASGLQHTKSSMTKTIQQKVDEINTLLRGVGGFNRQIKASFSRSAVVYLEQEDPKHSHRERVVFTVNLGDYELRYPLDETAEETVVEDGRTLRRLVWDEAVNTLSEIISNTGLKPKYVKNDKNRCIMEMRQYLETSDNKLPDEYFAFSLKHVNEEQKESSQLVYREKLDWFDSQIELYEKKMNSWFCGQKKAEWYQQEIEILAADRAFYIATTPDPEEMDTGLVFSIFVNTMKDYTLTKDKMQVIMTKFILALSQIATDKSMDQQVNQVYQHNQAEATSVQDLGHKLSVQEERAKRKVVKSSKKAS